MARSRQNRLTGARTRLRQRVVFQQASELTAKYVALMPTVRRWFSNSNDFGGDERGYSFDPATDLVFDIGFVTVAEDRAWIAWFTDED